ncbi:hypothetical protein BpHYR1_040545 [Brachionus plicatilis]|uniref:Uncharacterized protein n=1 Tax=Brachionus plicatilis TaxID=10195 RepID=A0A3M7R0S1_BRAPC|nr:hypothetical protein BpHYR1_040545 [Brachionus plicatilis]
MKILLQKFRGKGRLFNYVKTFHDEKQLKLKKVVDYILVDMRLNYGKMEHIYTWKQTKAFHQYTEKKAS